MKNTSDNRLLRFAAQVALENLVNQIISMLVPMLIGGISGSALAAVGMGNTVINMFTAGFSIMSTGGAVLLARAIGAGESEDASRIAGQSFLMAAVLSVLMAIGFWVAAVPFMRLLLPSAEEALFRESVVYFKYMMFSFPWLMIYTVGAALLRASGSARGPMAVTAALNVALIGLSFVFIRSMKLGMDGVGMAYVLARVISAVLMTLLLIRSHGSFRMRAQDIVRPHMATWRRIFRIGMPTSLESVLVQAGYLVGNAMAVGLGTFEATVYQVVNTVYSFGGYPQAICSTILVSFIGQLVGAGKLNEARKTARKIFYAGMGVTLGLAGCLAIFSEPVFRLYASDERVISECVRLSWVILVSNIPAMMINGTDPGLKAGGDMRFVMIYTVIGVWAIRVPLTWLFCYPLNMGVLGVFLANIVSLLMRGVCGQIRFFSNRWIHDKI